MMKQIGSTTLALALAALISPNAMAGSASQAGVAMADVSVIDSSTADQDGDGWYPVLVQHIKTPNQKELSFDVSLECGVYTKTQVRSKGGKRESATAEAGVRVRVLVDGEEAYPGPINFCRRTQELSATFQGIFDDGSGDSCLYLEPLDTDGDGVTDDYAERLDFESLQPEEVELVLDDMGAHAFNFLKPNVPPGDHTVVVEASVHTYTDTDGVDTSPDAQEAAATLGHGSMVIDVVRLVKDSDGSSVTID